MVEHLQSLALSEAEVSSIVEGLNEEWTVRSAEGMPGSANSLYAVDLSTPTGARSVICKCTQQDDPEAFRPEPYLLEALAERTTVPVPQVVRIVDHHEAVGGPLFVMERCAGEGVATRARSLAPSVRERIAYEAGRYLGEIHRVGCFGRFGNVRLASDVRGDGGGIETGDVRLTVSDDGTEDWRETFCGLTAWFLSQLDDRFVDLEGPLRDAIDDRLHLLGTPDPALMHLELTYWNLLVEPDTGAITAVLDFENKLVGDAAFDLVKAIDSLSALAPLESERRELVREALYAGYAETNTFPRGNDWANRRDLYRLAGRLPMLVFFKSGCVVGPDEPSALVREHRAFVRELL